MSSERPLESRTGGRAATTGVIPGDFAISVGNPNTLLPEGWNWTLLTDVARLETGHTPSRRHPEYWGGDVPWIGIRDATANHGNTIYSTAQYTNELGIRNSSARILPANTVCLSRTASVGYVIAMGVPMATSQDFVNWVCGPGLNYQFLKYVLLAERSSFLRFASGTTHQTIYFPEVKAFHVALPSLTIQQGIVDVLSTLDDRITLLRETNATMEAIAQALFKSWFVDFDPVRAKMEGRAPEGMDEAAAALFPDGFEESGLGLVPRGWNICALDEIATYLNGLALQKFPPAGNDDLPVIKIAQLRKGDTVGADMASRNIKPEYIIQNGDVLFSWSGSLEVDIWCGGEGALNQHLFKVTSAKFPKWFYYLWTKHHLEHFRQIAASKATTMGHIQRSHLSAAKVVVPCPRVLNTAHEILDKVVERIIENSLQAKNLAALRDTLLPRLISGQLRLPEAEALIA
ncbi:type I restriction endonuclease subunit S [Chromobacterium vaccinii]|uniref:restriction endonuclease subunit S n=1 Tax=Chromobacterium vaccinii TaxID=1108595 RepID=UPI000CE991E0|nr:restriction endonuclease subunit S [Chromobacterium vaccinii]AVG17754.1 type I restriction endonuclease subunit S [Chromobacterium vaccinii]